VVGNLIQMRSIMESTKATALDVVCVLEAAARDIDDCQKSKSTGF
jgi:hypothetical protein